MGVRHCSGGEGCIGNNLLLLLSRNVLAADSEGDAADMNDATIGSSGGVLLLLLLLLRRRAGGGIAAEWRGPPELIDPVDGSIDS